MKDHQKTFEGPLKRGNPSKDPPKRSREGSPFKDPLSNPPPSNRPSSIIYVMIHYYNNPPGNTWHSMQMALTTYILCAMTARKQPLLGPF